MLTREQVLSADDLKRERVDVPEWGGHVYVRALTCNERAQVMKEAGDDNDEGTVLLVLAAACDESGKPLFTRADLEALRGKGAVPMARVSKAALALLTPPSVESLEKNSEASPNGSLPSGSALRSDTQAPALSSAS